MNWKNSIETLKGVGEQRLNKFNTLDIFTLYDLITHFPRDHKDRSQLTKIDELELDTESTFLAYTKDRGDNIPHGRFTLTRIKGFDETGVVSLLWFNQAFMRNSLKPKEWYLFTGKLQKKYGKNEFVVTDYEKIDEGFAGGRIIPIYPTTKGLSQKMLRNFIVGLLSTLEETPFVEEMPKWICEKYNLVEKNFALKEIHFPTNEKDFYNARRRLVFEEFLLLQTALYYLKAKVQLNTTGTIMEHAETLKEAEKALPFDLTNAQKRVIEDIKNDLISGKQMNRLVQGDVGSGKTAVAMICSYWVIKNGFQAVLMCPTEVLATQHYQAFLDIFTPLGIEVVLLSGGQKAKEKRESLEKIKTGQGQMIIGTHAVIQEKVEYKNLGFAITDEQHRFGVVQRGTLSQKGDNPHVLVMTATPIPRTLALMVYGDLDISIIDELPPNRKSIDTSSVDSTYHKRIYDFIEKKIDEGRQAYVICPMIEENEKLEVLAVTEYTETLKNVFKNHVVQLVHGKIKAKEKQEIMEAFSKGEIDILVSTTVIEVGINVPNAVIMLIENAERFGLSQLHQLRGRVGRGSDKSYCILVSDSKSKVSKNRLKALVKSQDGFYLSEVDLELRGPGEFFGTMQHGLPEFKLGNIYRDMPLLLEAQQCAKKLLEIDSTLKKPEHSLWGDKIDYFLKNKILEI